MTLGWMKAVLLSMLWRSAGALRQVPVLMAGSASFAFEGDNLVLHLREVQLPSQLFQRAAFLGDSGDVVLLQLLHRLSACFAVAVFQVFQYLRDNFLVYLCKLFL